MHVKICTYIYVYIGQHVCVCAHIRTYLAAPRRQSCHRHRRLHFEATADRGQDAPKSADSRTMPQACPTYEWVTSHIQIRHVPHINGSCSTADRGQDAPRSPVFWFIHMRLMTHWYVGHDSSAHDSFMCGTWLLYSQSAVLWFIHMRLMTHLYAGHDS